MRKKIVILTLITLSCLGMAAGCGRTNFSDDVVVIESDEVIDISGKRYLSDIEHYYYTFYKDGTMHLESLNGKYQFDGTYEIEEDKVTLSAKNTDGKNSIITYTMKHGEPEDSVVMITEEGEKFLLTLEENL